MVLAWCEAGMSAPVLVKPTPLTHVEGLRGEG